MFPLLCIHATIKSQYVRPPHHLNLRCPPSLSVVVSLVPVSSAHWSSADAPSSCDSRLLCMCTHVCLYAHRVGMGEQNWLYTQRGLLHNLCHSHMSHSLPLCSDSDQGVCVVLCVMFLSRNGVDTKCTNVIVTKSCLRHGQFTFGFGNACIIRQIVGWWFVIVVGGWRPVILLCTLIRFDIQSLTLNLIYINIKF